MDWIMFTVYILGVPVGIIISYFFIPYAGILKIDRTNPDKDLYLIDIPGWI